MSTGILPLYSNRKQHSVISEALEPCHLHLELNKHLLDGQMDEWTNGKISEFYLPHTNLA